jgi:hypothetical protein
MSRGAKASLRRRFSLLPQTRTINRPLSPLYSLYNTRQADKQQVQDIESTMVSRITP